MHLLFCLSLTMKRPVCLCIVLGSNNPYEGRVGTDLSLTQLSQQNATHWVASGAHMHFSLGPRGWKGLPPEPSPHESWNPAFLNLFTFFLTC